MNITVFSMGPLFPSHVHGGSQKTLQTVLAHLSDNGHSINVFCTRRDDNHEPFQLAENVTINPVLRFKQTYPEPYYTAPYNLTSVISELSTALSSTDVFYIHDGELYYDFLFDEVPTVVALQDFVYPDTLGGSLSFRRDQLVVISDYLLNCVRSTFAPFRPLPADRISVAPNGFDLHEFKPKPTESLRSEIGLDDDAIPILFPHRPDPRKGFYESLEIMRRLLPRLSKSVRDRVKLLMPIWIDSQIATDSSHVYQSIYEDIQSKAEEYGLHDLIRLHRWFPVDRMPEYYSLGVATLCIGNFIEAFGNVSVESVICGTPCVVSRVGAQRTVLPDDLIVKVDYGDYDAICDALQEIIESGARTGAGVREFVRDTYSPENTVKRYADVIENCRRSTPIPTRYGYQGQTRKAIHAPWCYRTTQGVYNDYQYEYATDNALVKLWDVVSDEGLVLNGDVDGAAVINRLDEFIKAGYFVYTEEA